MDVDVQLERIDEEGMREVEGMENHEGPPIKRFKHLVNSWKTRKMRRQVQINLHLTMKNLNDIWK